MFLLKRSGEGSGGGRRKVEEEKVEKELVGGGGYVDGEGWLWRGLLIVVEWMV